MKVDRPTSARPLRTQAALSIEVVARRQALRAIRVQPGSSMNEIVFVVEEAPEGGYIARALGAAIFTEADSMPELRVAVKDAVHCHFDQASGLPAVIRLHFVRDELISA